MDRSYNDLNFLASSTEFKEYLNQNNLKRNKAEEKLLKLIKLRDVYAQLRLISLDTGMEIVRVNRDDIHTSVVKKKYLQNKGLELYFKEISRLDADEIYTSQVELNREHGKISYPKKLVFRIARKIVNVKNNSKYFVIINIDFSKIIESFLNRFEGLQYLIVANTSGQLIIDMSNHENMHDISKEASTIHNSLKKINTSEIVKYKDFQVFRRIISFGNNQNLTFFAILNINKVQDTIYRIISDTLGYIILLFSVLVVGSIFIAKKLTTPVVQLNRFAQRALVDENIDIKKFPVESNDEIGDLTRTLLKMYDQLSGNNRELKDKQSVIDSAAIVAETDENGIITYVNDKFIELSGYSRDELVGRDHRIVNSGYHSTNFFKGMWATLKAGKVWRGEVRNRHKNGTCYWMNTTIFPSIVNGKIVKFTSIRFDITERKNAEEKLKETGLKLVEAMKVKTNFLANMSHEIRTPLNSILGITEVLTEFEHSPEVKQFIQSIRNSGDSLMQIVNDILDLSKIEAGQLSLEEVQFDLQSLLEETATTFSVQATKKNINLLHNIDFSANYRVIGDPYRLRQIINNLVSNAIKFTSKGFVEISAKEIFHDEKKSKAVFEITVKDTGVGIKEEYIEHIFESFTQADESISRNFGGTGLGLNIVKKLIEKMGGDISISSLYGQGSEFKVCLPMKYNPTSSIIKNSIQFLLSGKNILFYDDTLKSHHSISKKIIDWGANVDTVTSIDDFKKKVEDGQTLNRPYDLFVLADVISFFRFDPKNLLAKLGETKIIGIIPTINKEYVKNLLASYHINEIVFDPVGKCELQLVIESIYSHENKSKVLVIDDEPDILVMLQDYLIQNQAHITLASTYEDAKYELLNGEDFDLILSDINLKEKNAGELLANYKKSHKNIPIIVMSGMSKSEMQEIVPETIASDYLEKPFTFNALRERFQNLLFLKKEIVEREKEAIEDYHAVKILVAEDSIDNQNLFKIYFKDTNYILDFADDGEDAFDKFKKNKYDLVFMDMQMPILDGLGATKLIRGFEEEKNIVHTPVVALTANVMNEEKEKALNAGCSDFLTKPIKKKEIMKYLKNYFNVDKMVS